MQKTLILLMLLAAVSCGGDSQAPRIAASLDDATLDGVEYAPLEGSLQAGSYTAATPLGGGYDIPDQERVESVRLLFTTLDGYPEQWQLLLFPGERLRIDGVLHDDEGNAELEAVQALVERGADINVRDDATGWTPLMWACSGAFEGYWDAYKGDDAARLAQTEEAIDYLLDMGADPGIVSVEGDTAWSLFEVYVGDRTIGDLSEDAAAEALSTYESRLNP